MVVNSGACGNFSLKFIGSQKSDIGLSLNSKLTEKCFCISVTSSLSLAKATVEVRQSSSNFRLCGRSFSRPISVCRSLTVFQYLKYLQVVPKYPQLPNIHSSQISTGGVSPGDWTMERSTTTNSSKCPATAPATPITLHCNAFLFVCLRVLEIVFLTGFSAFWCTIVAFRH